jgi:Tfp pilus assembly protein PilV
MIARLRHAEAGFTLVEVMVAATVLVVGVLGTVSMVDAANQDTSKNHRREIATATARDVIEATRGLPYTSLINGTTQADVQAKPGLADGDAVSGWQITRSNVQFTVTLQTCALDDANDGAGVHPAGVFCSDAIAAGAADPKPNDFSRVRVTVSWKTPRGTTESLTQSSIINNTYRGPKVTGIDPAAYVLNGSPATKTTTFSATTSAPADRIEWYTDGKYRSTGSTFPWNFGNAYGGTASGCAAIPATGPGTGNLLDGTYQIGAQAFDSSNSTFGPIYVPAKLNRCPPAAPTGLQGGRVDGSNIDLQWYPNPEDDVVGYYVYRTTSNPNQSGNFVKLTGSGGCAGLVKGKTSCSDPDTGSIANTTVYYKVAAVDLTDIDNPNSTARAGDLSTYLQVTTNNRAPGTPVIYDASTYGTLFWYQVTDPDNGDAVDFYRIYRDGQLYDTWDYVSGPYVLWTDPDTGGTSHTYYVTAVDTHLKPSANSNTVTK